MSNKTQQRDGVGSAPLEDFEKELVAAEKRGELQSFERNEHGQMVPIDLNGDDD